MRFCNVKITEVSSPYARNTFQVENISIKNYVNVKVNIMLNREKIYAIFRVKIIKKDSGLILGN